jgi:hypothetical protein
MRSVFGTLGSDPHVVQGLTELVRLLDQDGLEAALDACRLELLPSAA